jgi:hypothetical protein
MNASNLEILRRLLVEDLEWARQVLANTEDQNCPAYHARHAECGAYEYVLELIDTFATEGGER